jgi:N-glycosylase/DNA lyase
MKKRGKKLWVAFKNFQKFFKKIKILKNVCKFFEKSKINKFNIFKRVTHPLPFTLF